jgi:AcrR family transcriptional regulator
MTRVSAPDHRRRAVEAFAAVVAERGLRETRVSDVLERAGMSRRTFYALFDNLEDCFLEAYELALDRVRRALCSTAEASPEDWPALIEQVLHRLLEGAAAHPGLARVLLVEPLAAGPAGVERHERTMRELAALLARSHLCAGEHPVVAFEAAVGAVHRVVHARLVAGRADELPALAGDLAGVLCRLTTPAAV